MKLKQIVRIEKKYRDVTISRLISDKKKLKQLLKKGWTKKVF